MLALKVITHKKNDIIYHLGNCIIKKKTVHFDDNVLRSIKRKRAYYLQYAKKTLQL